MNQNFEKELAAIEGELVGDVAAQKVDMAQSGASHISASEVKMYQSGAEVIHADRLETHQSGVVLANVKEKAVLHQSGAGFLNTRQAQMEGSKVAILMADSVSAENSRAVLVLAGHAEGSIETLFDANAAIRFGLGVGLALGVIWLLRGLLGRRR